MQDHDSLKLNRLNDLTIDEVRALGMFKHFSDAEAQ